MLTLVKPSSKSNQKKMCSNVYRNLSFLSLKKSSYLCTPPVSHSLSLLFFSSSRPKSSERVALADYLINQHNFSPKAALKASTAVSSNKFPQKLDSVLSFLKEICFSKSHVEKIIQAVPGILYANLDKTLKPKFKIFLDYGFSHDEVAEVISSDQWILTRAADKLGPSISVLKTVLGSNASVVKALRLYGRFLKFDLEKTMMPSIQYLESCGINSEQINTYIFSFPRFFLHKPENMRRFVKKVDELGFNRKSKMFLQAIRTVGSMKPETWELKLKLFRDLGFSEEDILVLFRRSPQVFVLSERKIKDVTELLTTRGKLDLSYIVNHPFLLTCSVEGRIKPRLEVLQILESKNLLQRKVGLATICKMVKAKFLEKYVVPHSHELDELVHHR